MHAIYVELTGCWVGLSLTGCHRKQMVPLAAKGGEGGAEGSAGQPGQPGGSSRGSCSCTCRVANEQDGASGE